MLAYSPDALGNMRRLQPRCRFWDFIKFKDSRHAQMPIYAVFHEEFDFPLENAQFWQLDVKNEEKRNVPDFVSCYQILRCFDSTSWFQTIPAGKWYSWASGIRFSSRKCSILTVRREKRGKTKWVKFIFRFFEHSSYTTPQFYTPLGGNASYGSPAPF